MAGLLSGMAAMIIPAIMQLGVAGSVEVTPQEATKEFLDAFKAADHQVIGEYVDNKYVNFIENPDETEGTSDIMYQCLFENMSYAILAEASKNDVAVVKVKLLTNDFSQVDEKYAQESYKFVTSNLYSDQVTDKGKLSAKCLEIYLEELKEAAATEPATETTIYLPLIKDDHYGWKVVVKDENMKAICGGIDLPETEK